MGIYDFMILSNEEQLAHVMFYGSLVAKLCVKQKHYHLYSVGKFFFEMEYNTSPGLRGEEALLLRRHIFGSGVRMDKYIDSELVV